jgi:hypothetical protein
VAPELGAVLAVVDEVQLPLHFHTFPTTPPRARQEAPPVRRAAMFTGVSAFQMGLIHIIAGTMGAGVFERCPPRAPCSLGGPELGIIAGSVFIRAQNKPRISSA